jgi:spoIIIJ-associated protein
MSGQHATLEVIAPSIDEAVSKGLNDLGLPLEAVEVEILDEGSKGFLGIGGRHARVRLTIKEDGAESSTKDPAPRPEKPAAARASASAGLSTGFDDEENVLAIARETVSELLEKMKVKASVDAHFGDLEDERRTAPVIVDINGRDLSILIGRHAATLNALQYISRLIVSKELGRSLLLILDVEGYRSRRERQLRRLAKQMAEQAVETGRRQMLEPMPANERRIIHIELRENSDVTTESFGEEPRRKVTISPK